MAYAQYNNPSLLDIPALICNFAVDVLGWQLVGDTEIRPPQMDADLHFEVTATVAGGHSRYREYFSVALRRGSVQLGATASANSPYINTVFQLPSRLYLFGGDMPENYLAAVVEYSPGFFRHLYMGYVEKIGNYSGGEVTAGSFFSKDNNSATSYATQSSLYPFSGLLGGTSYNPPHKGMMRIVADEVGGESICAFSAPDRNNNGNLTSGSILGGFSDNTNRNGVFLGNSPFSGTSQLTPINLFRCLPSNRVQPVGRPAGIRLVNIKSLDPNTSVIIGDTTWRVFPVFKKTNTGTAAGANYTDESSYIVGLAYQEG